MVENTSGRVLRTLKALSDTQRLRILMMLAHGELCVCNIVEVLGLAPSTVSKHLRLLNESNLVVSRKEGRWVYYRLAGTDSDDFDAPLMEWLMTSLREDQVVRRDASALAKIIPVFV